jgi:predicted dehydrogenase
MIPAGLIGYGYWGPNLLRNLNASGRFEVKAIAEPERERLELARRVAPGASRHVDARELSTSGALGKISYYDSLRINLGLFEPDVNVLWDLAPHDFSILDYVISVEPIHVEATGYCHVNPHMPDIAYVTIHCAGGVIAHFNLSWMSPAKGAASRSAVTGRW